MLLYKTFKGVAMNKSENNDKRNSLFTMYECLANYSKEEIDSALSKLNEKDIQVLKQRYGEDFCHPIRPKDCGRNTYQASRYIVECKIPKMLGALKYKLVSSIYIEFSQYSKDEIDLAISKLNDKDKNILKLKYGEDFSHPVQSKTLNSSDYTKVYYIKKERLKPLLKNPNYPVYVRKNYIQSNAQPKSMYSNIYEYFSNYSREEVDLAISKLKETDIQVLKQRYGEDFSHPLKNKFPSNNDVRRFYRIFENKLPRLLNEQKSFNEEISKMNIAPSLYENFPNYSKEEADCAFAKLGEQDRKILKLVYGDNLDTLSINKKYSEKIYKDTANILRFKLKILMKNPSLSYAKPVNKWNLYEYFPNYSREEVNIVIDKLTDQERLILKQRYGDNFDESLTPLDDGLKFSQKIRHIKLKMRRLLNDSSLSIEGRNVNLYEYFSNYSEEEINIVIAKLTERERALLKQRYGEDFRKVISFKESKEANYDNIFDIRKKIKEMLDNPNSRVHNRGISCNIYAYFSPYSKEEIDLAVSKLNARDSKVLKLRFGEDLLQSPKETGCSKQNLAKFRNTVRPKIEKLLDDPKGQSLNGTSTIYKYFNNYSKEKIDLAISKLSEEDRHLLTLRYGEDLEHPVKALECTSKDIKDFYAKLLPKIMELLKDPNLIASKDTITKKIYEYFPLYSKEEVDLAISKLPNKDKDALKLRFGEDYQKPRQRVTGNKDDSIRLYNILNGKMTRLLINPHISCATLHCSKTVSIYNVFSDYSKEEVDLAISKLTNENRRVLKLRYGEDYSHPVKAKDCGKKVYVAADYLIRNKMPKILTNPIDINEKSKTEYMAFNDYNQDKVEVIISKLPNIDKALQSDRTTSDGIRKKVYTSILDTLKIVQNDERFNNLDFKDMMAVSLSSINVDNVTFQPNEIANMLGLDEQHVQEISRNFSLANNKDNNNNNKLLLKRNDIKK